MHERPVERATHPRQPRGARRPRGDVARGPARPGAPAATFRDAGLDVWGLLMIRSQGAATRVAVVPRQGVA